MRSPRPIAELPAIEGVAGVLCDIDDTLTTEGRIIPAALAVMEAARREGLRVVPVTGRPAGWVDHIARMWPVDGVVGENGGLWAWRDGEKLRFRYLQGEEERAANRARLDALAREILAEVPGTALASDQPYRALDLAVDYREDVPALDPAAVQAIVEAFRRRGATCKVSSIHVNGWFGDFDKLVGFRRLHRDLWGTEVEPARWVFFGDSANDEPMFREFPLSIGVANVRRFLPHMEHGPAWIAQKEGGFGFAEGMARVLAARSV